MSGLANYFAIKPEKTTEFIAAIDKIEKIGYEKVVAEIKEKGMVSSKLKLESPDHGGLSFLNDLLAKQRGIKECLL